MVNNIVHSENFTFKEVCHSCLNDIRYGLSRLFSCAKNKCSCFQFCHRFLYSEDKNCQDSSCHCKCLCSDCIAKFLSDFNCNLDDIEKGNIDNTTMHRNDTPTENTIINVMHYNKEGKHEKSIEKNNDTCIICSDNISGAVVLPCMHTNFCYSCIEKWQDKMGSCPTCREKITDIVQYI